MLVNNTKLKSSVRSVTWYSTAAKITDVLTGTNIHNYVELSTRSVRLMDGLMCMRVVEDVNTTGTDRSDMRRVLGVLRS